MNFSSKETILNKMKKATNIIFNTHCCVNLHVRYLLFVYIFIALGIVMIPCILKMIKSEKEFEKYHHASIDTVFTIGNCKLDWWSVTHFVLYIILGFAFPHLWKLILFCSIFWELFEYFIGCIEKYVKNEHSLVYWCGKWSDLFINTSGFIVGLTLRYIMTLHIV